MTLKEYLFGYLKYRSCPQGATNALLRKHAFQEFNHSGFELFDVFNITVEVFDIKNPAMFLANMVYESGHFKHTKESFNYFIDALHEIYPKEFGHFTLEQLYKKYDKSGDKFIANQLYANRLGNGDFASGDGWTFRGQGYIQITGRENFTRVAEWLNAFFDNKLDLDPSFVAFIANKVDGAMYVSGAWWAMSHDLNSKDITFDDAVRFVSGTDKTLKQRKTIYEKILTLKEEL